jgi:aspartate aminotransferase
MYRRIPLSSTLLLNEQSQILEKTGRQVFHFGFGQSPFPVSPILRDALMKSAHHKEYTPVQGLKSLRDQVAKYHSSFEQRQISGDQVFIAPGSKALIYTIMSAYEQAAVLIPAPAWVSYAPQAKLIGHSSFLMQTEYTQRYRITAEQLEITLKKASKDHETLLVVLNSPGTVDSGYQGEIKVILFNTTIKKVKIEKGQKVAQAVLCPVIGGRWVDLVKVSEIKEKDRNNNGFGSTGL